MYQIPSLDEVLRAQKRIAPYITRTPLHHYPSLDELLGAEVYVKHENHESLGAFKLRGALNTIIQLTEEDRSKGIISSSTRGVWGGGRTPTKVNTIEYITMASLGDGTDFGDLTDARGYPSGFSSMTRGVFGGGYDPSGSNIIDYITIATTGNATDFGNATSGNTQTMGASGDAS